MMKISKLDHLKTVIEIGSGNVLTGLNKRIKLIKLILIFLPSEIIKNLFQNTAIIYEKKVLVTEHQEELEDLSAKLLFKIMN